MGPAAGARRSGGAVMRAAAVGVVVALVSLALAPPLAAALRPLRERVASVGATASAASWGDEVRMVLLSWDSEFSSSLFPHFGLSLSIGVRANRQLRVEQSNQRMPVLCLVFLNLFSAIVHFGVYTTNHTLALQSGDSK
jgi:hypothetical protein